jgi:hypothetical protein
MPSVPRDVQPSRFAPVTWTATSGSLPTNDFPVANGRPGVFRADDVVFPTTFSEGILFEWGEAASATNAAFLGWRTRDSTNYLYFAAGAVGSDPAFSTTDVAVLKTTDFPADGLAHDVVWEFAYPDNVLTLRLWIDDDLKGTAAVTGAAGVAWASPGSGAFAVYNGGNTVRSGTPTASWPGSVDRLKYFAGAVVGVGPSAEVKAVAVAGWGGTSPYSLRLEDAGGIVEMINVSTAHTVRIPADAEMPFAVGTVISIMRMGPAAATVSADVGVTLLGPSASAGLGGSVDIAAQYSGVLIYKRAANEWVVQGDIA